MDHEALTARIPDLMAGNLGRIQRWRFKRHLKSCAPCQAELGRFQRIHEDLESAVPEYLSKEQPSPELMSRIHQAVSSHPLPATAPRSTSRVRMSGLPRFAIPAFAAVLAAVAIVLLVTLSGGNGAVALSLETPVRGTLSITQGGEPVADGTFTYVSPELWERTTSYSRMPERLASISEISVDGEVATKQGDDPWMLAAQVPVDRQPIPGLGDLGLTERLFDAVLNTYQLEQAGSQVFEGEELVEFAGSDLDYGNRIRDSFPGVNREEADALFEFYQANPPDVTALADDEERIRAIFITVQLREVTEPMIIRVVIDEFNVPADITFPIS